MSDAALATPQVVTGYTFHCERCGSARFAQELAGTRLAAGSALRAAAVLRCEDCGLGVQALEWMTRHWHG